MVTEPGLKRWDNRPALGTFHDRTVVAAQAASPLQKGERYPALDGLRAIAVLMVFAQHYFLSFFQSLWQWGWAGVDVFFVLSGFLITGILYDTRENVDRFKNFYIRRTLRIFPLYYGVWLLIVLVWPLMHWKWSLPWICWPFYLGNYVRFAFFNGFLQSGGSLEALVSTVPIMHAPLRIFLGHFWSLAIEEQFYLLWPLVVFGIGDRVKLRNLCLAVVVVMPFIRLLTGLLVSSDLLRSELLYRITPLRIDALLIGGLLSLIRRGPEGRYFASIAPKIAMACASLLIAAPFAAPIIAKRAVDLTPRSLGMSSFGFTIIDLLAACIISVAIQKDSSLYALLVARPLRKLGEMSYGFYVFHDIPHSLYFAFTAYLLGGKITLVTAFVSVPIALVSTLVLSYLSYRYLERPFLRLKSRFAP